MPEQIVRDEHMIAHRRHVLAHRVDRSFAHRPRMQLPDRTERASKWTPTRGLDERRWTMSQTGVLTPPGFHVVACGQRYGVERERSGFAAGPQDPAVTIGKSETRNRR